MWQNPFAHPDPRAAIERAVGLVHRLPARPSSPGPGQSFLGALADDALWEALRRDRHRRRPHRPGEAGRRPRRAGEQTPSRRRPLRPDQHADRPDVRHRGRVPRAVRGRRPRYGGTIIDDIVPGHTGKGADFRLAEMSGRRLPGHLPHGRRSRARTGTCCPRSRPGTTRSTSDVETEQPARAGRLHHRPAAAGDLRTSPGSRRPTGAPPAWSPGVDGVERRWVYLHYFKAGPALDQLARPVLRRDAAGDRRRAARAGRPRRRRACGWTPTASSGSRRAPRRRRPGPRATRSPRRRTS